MAINHKAVLEIVPVPGYELDEVLLAVPRASSSSGGELLFEMGATPNKALWSAPWE